jgi:membrane associated rhomboid family serine protease
MGAFDREYFREERRHAGRPPLPPVTKWLLIANLVVFVLDFVSRPGPEIPQFGHINTLLCFTVRSAFLEGRLWELLSFQFLHGSIGHIIFNGIGLYFFGPWMERWWGSRRFTAYYLLCGVGGALFYTLLTVAGILPERGLLAGIDTPLVGASAGLYGFIVGVAFIQPKAMVQLLIPPVTLTMRNAALIFIGIAVAMIAGDILLGGSLFQNSGGEAGHLGGALAGFLLMKFPFLLGKGGRPGKIIRPREFRPRAEPKLRPRSEVDLAAAGEVDRILDKIARDGLQSLSEEERKTLHQAAAAYDKS